MKTLNRVAIETRATAQGTPGEDLGNGCRLHCASKGERGSLSRRQLLSPGGLTTPSSLSPGSHFYVNR